MSVRALPVAPVLFPVVPDDLVRLAQRSWGELNTGQTWGGVRLSFPRWYEVLYYGVAPLTPVVPDPV